MSAYEVKKIDEVIKANEILGYYMSFIITGPGGKTCNIGVSKEQVEKIRDTFKE